MHGRLRRNPQLIFYLEHIRLGHSIPPPEQTILREFHRAGTILLLTNPGNYRREDVHVGNKITGAIVHQPPAWQEVDGHVDTMFREISELWPSADALDVASYALWRINWVHPFKNGNGRTARAFAYTCLCAKLGVVLPGAPTVIDQIMATRDRLGACLKAGDDSFARTGASDLSEMKAYLNDLLQIQIASLEEPSPS
jgi:hypothetical protein